MPRRRDHYLPATHLRGFSLDRKRLWQLDKQDDSTRFVSVRDAAVARGLNTLRRDGIVSRDLESYMARFNESAAAPLISRLRSRPTGRVALSADENGRLGRYVALTYARSPGQRAMTRRNAETTARSMARELEDPDDFARRVARAGIRADGLAIEVARLRSLVRLREGKMPDDVLPWAISVGIAVTRAAPFVANMSKFIVRRERNPLMVCGDCAVVLMKDTSYWHQGAIGFGTPDVRAIMPLAPDAFLICGFIDEDCEAAEIGHWASAQFASFVNCASVDQADRFVFGRDRGDIQRVLSALAENRASTEIELNRRRT